MAKPVSETQSINPGSVIEMFELTTDAALHGSATTYRFHDGSNPIALETLMLMEISFGTAILISLYL